MDGLELRAVPLFAERSDEERGRLASRMKEMRLPEGSVITEQGDLPFEFFGLLEGTASVEPSGERTAELGPGDFLGESSASSVATREVRAMSPVRLAVLAGWDLNDLLEDFPRLRHRVDRVMEERDEPI